MEPQVRLVDIMAPTFEERQQRRLYIAVSLARVLEHIIQRGLIHKMDPPAEALDWERMQRAHIMKYMRRPQNPLLEEIERQMGGRIDRLSFALCDAIRAWDTLIKVRHSKAYRKMQETKREAERQAKLLQRRKREQERLAGVAPRPKTKKVVEHEEVERCSKCHKRPAVKSGLCDPCFAWEHASLGRE